MEKIVTFAGQPMRIACDERCDKAWGIDSRPEIQLDPDDPEGSLYWLSDDELETAPEDPGTIEGFDAKPANKEEMGNKWCARHCERCACSDYGKSHLPVTLPDFSKRIQI